MIDDRGDIRLEWEKIKVQLFWEGHKNVSNRPYGFEIYLVNVKTKRTIVQTFEDFSEKLNFIRISIAQLEK